MRFSVADTGHGIPPDKLDIVFEPFRQLENAAPGEHKGKGTGPGLAIVKSFVELHGGTVEVESEVGKGPTFSFVIPQDAGYNRKCPGKA